MAFGPFWSETTLPIFVWNRALFSREIRECMNVVFVSIPNEEGNRNTPGALNTRIRNAFEEFFWFALQSR